MKYQILFLGLFVFSILSSCDENPKSNAGNSLSVEEKEAFVKKGKGIAMATFNTLSSELGKAIQEGGVAKAVKTCNIAAYPLVDSLSKAHNATIRRTSLKIRNPKNKPSQSELKVLNSYEKAVQYGEKLKPKVVELDGMVSFYAPIITQPLCLNCHGKVGETLKTEDNVLIKTLYPQDQAIGYEAGNLRGVWSIEFKK